MAAGLTRWRQASTRHRAHRQPLSLAKATKRHEHGPVIGHISQVLDSRLAEGHILLSELLAMNLEPLSIYFASRTRNSTDT